MKKIVSLLLALTLVLGLFAGCGSSEPAASDVKAETKAPTEAKADASAAAEPAEKKLTIAGIVFKDEFTMKMVQQGYEDAAADYGVDIVIGNSMGDLANEQQLV